MGLLLSFSESAGEIDAEAREVEGGDTPLTVDLAIRLAVVPEAVHAGEACVGMGFAAWKVRSSMVTGPS
jgi:hypothetical protein